jgi:hypothetical protein
MKRYIKASTEKPTLDQIKVVWSDLEDGSGIMYSVYSEDDELLFEEVLDYQDVDPDAAYDSAPDMAILVLSQTYDLTDEVIQTIKSNKP